MLRFCRVGVHAQQQVGAGEVEEQSAWDCTNWARFSIRRSFTAVSGISHRQQGIAGLGRGQQVADRADAADAGHERGHLVERPAFAELLEAAELGDVELRVGDVALVVQLDGDPAVAFDAGDRIDRDRSRMPPLAAGRRSTGRCQCLTHGSNLYFPNRV